ncbi:uncharacterized protein LOC126552878 isoform X2 [Aphis gossypii]|uniref:uncharacterized protein LOC126552878 isoform X2 n=1 Tax=Aphis gossypii TaxID=80765 RepID=UPI0021594CA0|nr:uncharacterized protein LOC126552878 isoform X2 [Aphis gossypii]
MNYFFFHMVLFVWEWPNLETCLAEFVFEKLLIVENQYYLEMDQVRRHLQIRSHLSQIDRAEVTSTIQNYVGILNENGDLSMFLRRAGHLMDGYYRKQVRPQPLEQ